MGARAAGALVTQHVGGRFDHSHAIVEGTLKVAGMVPSMEFLERSSWVIFGGRTQFAGNPLSILFPASSSLQPSSPEGALQPGRGPRRCWPTHAARAAIARATWQHDPPRYPGKLLVAQSGLGGSRGGTGCHKGAGSLLWARMCAHGSNATWANRGHDG